MCPDLRNNSLADPRNMEYNQIDDENDCANDNRFARKHYQKEVWLMISTYSRPCTVSESIARSCREVKSMRTGQSPKRSLDDFFSRIGELTKERRECYAARD